jgi:hypothetical protein
MAKRRQKTKNLDVREQSLGRKPAGGATGVLLDVDAGGTSLSLVRPGLLLNQHPAGLCHALQRSSRAGDPPYVRDTCATTFCRVETLSKSVQRRCQKAHRVEGVE